MTGRETEFEEDSFEDEFEPEEEMALYRKVPKAPPRGVPSRAGAQARQLSSMLQRSLGLQERPLAAAAAAAAADGLADGDDEAMVTLTSPRSLKQLAAHFLLLTTGKGNIQKMTIPGHLYSLLLAEAACLKNEEGIVHLVSTWPFSVLNLNDVDIPLEDYVTREPENSPCVAELIIKGLFYRKRKFCNMQMVILPKDTVVSVQILAHFARIPFHYCSRLPNLKIPQILSAGKLKEAAKYVQEVPKLEFRREINFYSYMKGNVKLVVAVPIAVVHWLGRKANINDVHAGLILQKHAPFVFHFDNIALINFVDTYAISTVLDLVVQPEKVKKMLLKNKRVFRPDHVSYIMSNLSVSLKRFTGLHGFFTKLSALIGYGPDNYALDDSDKENIADVFHSFTQLARLNINDQPLDVPGSFAALFTPVIGRLTKLSLVRCQLTPEDVKIIADSHHVETLQLLRLDYNDLNPATEQVCELLSKLKAISTLRMQACRIKYRNCLRCAEALAHSQTLRIWNFTDNVMFKVRHIKEFVEICSNIISLRAIGCKPLEYHVLLGKVVVPSKKGLSESKKRELEEFAESLNLIVF